MTLDLDRLRAETPGCAHRIHFNNAGAGLMPAPVLEAMTGQLTLEDEIGGYEAADARAAEIGDFYAATGELLGCGAHNVAFAPSATEAYARALSSIPFEPGDVILTGTPAGVGPLAAGDRVEVEVSGVGVRSEERRVGKEC